MKLKAMHKFILSIVLFLAAMPGSAQSKHKLWYKEPAQYFEQTLVLGNGKMGASVFGGVESDKIYLHDITLWSGGPVNPNMNPEAFKNIPAIREALQNENYQLADQLQKKIQGKFSESYAPLGTMYLNFQHQGKPSDYYRELDISRAVSKVTYVADGTEFSREYFVSFPAKVMVIRLSSGKKGAMNFNVRLKSQLRNQTTISGKEIYLTGNAPGIAR